MTATTHDELSMEAILRRIRERYAEEQLREQLTPLVPTFDQLPDV
jgi:hypothetical protein